MTESDLTEAVLELLDLFGFRAMHTRPARTAHGWRTPLQGPTATGFPDVLAVRRDRVLAVELKVGRNRPTSEQQAWLAALDRAGVETYLWTDRSWNSGEIECVLRCRPADVDPDEAA